MNSLLTCAFNLWRQRPASGGVQVTVVSDSPHPCARVECERMLAPWAEWVELIDYIVVAGPVDSDFVRRAGLHGDSVVMASAEEDEILNSLVASCKDAGVAIVTPHFPIETLDLWMFREVCHFDFELGGKNEWDGTRTVYGSEELRLLSSTHCKDYFPTWALPQMLTEPPPAPENRIHALDVGCGPISQLRWGALLGYLTITGLDPLIDMYALVLARHGLDHLPAIACQHKLIGVAEDLDTLAGDALFDLIYTQNALDHTRRPEHVVNMMGARLAPGGCVLIQVGTREGTRRGWEQFHSTDIYLDDETLMYAHQHTPAKPLLSADCGLRMKKVHHDSPEDLAVELEHQASR